MTKQLTPFETVKQQLADGTRKAPIITGPNGPINPIVYELATHKFYLSLMVKGMQNRQVKLSDLKKFYGLKGRTAADIYPAFMEIFNAHAHIV